MFCVLLFVHGSTPICWESTIFKLLDCSDKQVKSIDHLVISKREWVVVIDFKRNRLVSFNVTELLLAFPNLRHIDVRDNPTLDCRLLRESRIEVNSDCGLGLSAVRARLSFSTTMVTPYQGDKGKITTTDLLTPNYFSLPRIPSRTLTPTPALISNSTQTLILIPITNPTGTLAPNPPKILTLITTHTKTLTAAFALHEQRPSQIELLSFGQLASKAGAKRRVCVEFNLDEFNCN